MNKIRIVENKPTVKENTPVSVGLNMDQTDAVYKVLEDNFGEEHMKDMFTLGSLSFYNMMVKGGIAGVFKEGKVNEAPSNLSAYGIVQPPKGGASIAGKYNILKGKTNSNFIAFDYKEGSDKPYGIVMVSGEGIYGDPLLKSLGLRQTRSSEAGVDIYIHNGNQDPVYVTEKQFEQLAQLWSGGFVKAVQAQADFYKDRGKTSGTIDEQPDVLNKIADMFDRKYPHLKFDVNTMFDRIEVRGDDQDVFTFGEELAGQKIFDYEITTIDKEGRNYEVRIVRSDSIVRNAVNPTNEEKPGLWANIRAKQERGEKPARKGSKAYKIAKKAGDEINKEK
jgi:hypothetical protein